MLNHDILNQNLQPFVETLKAMDLAHQSPEACLKLVKPVVSQWVCDDHWLPQDCCQANSKEDDYVIYAEPEAGLFILVVVWPAGNMSAIHDHHTWATVGVVKGHEENVWWRRTDDGSREGFATVERHRSIEAGPGDVFTMTDACIHSVRSADPKVDAVSLHVYGADLRTNGRYLYDPAEHSVKPYYDLDT